MKIGIASTDIAVELKDFIIEYLNSKDIEIVDFSKNNITSLDYGELVGNAILNKEIDGGILICGTGFGISISANKLPGIRACVCSEPYTAKISKQNSDSNIIAFGSKVVGKGLAQMIVDTWINTKYEESDFVCECMKDIN